VQMSAKEDVGTNKSFYETRECATCNMAISDNTKVGLDVNDFLISLC